MKKEHAKKGWTKGRRILLIVFSTIFGFVLLSVSFMLSAPAPRVNAITSYEGGNAYITFTDRPLISAHRAGGALAPENTLSAFELCMTATDYTVDVLEFDLHITADGKLVLLHDDTLDRTSNAVEYFGYSKVLASSRTYAELRELNMAENFKATDGSYPYRGLRGDEIPNDCKIVLIEEVLDYLEQFNLNFIIEIKDGDDNGRTATDLLYQTLNERNLLNKAIIGTFQDEITKYMDETYPEIIRSASIAEVLSFYCSFLVGSDLSKQNVGYDVLQIPYKDYVINLGLKSIIDYAHSFDIALQYWTINDANEIKELVDAGADCIITDNPAIAYQTIFG
ncbi:MAG: glycerophosphodiester phosphodiesterase family protein [Clostridia bacterium]|nr:glycerophosphodiester phosphodiesterase family protein [Clostridia bacterium]